MSDSYSMSRRRLRQSKAIRDLVATTSIDVQHLIQPYFIYEGLSSMTELPSMTGQKKHTTSSILSAVEQGLQRGVRHVLLFCVPKTKRERDFDYRFETSVIRSIKERFHDDITVVSDACLCSQTHTGHCGFLDHEGRVDNASTVLELTQKALAHADAGVDIVAPSDMMDDRILAMRRALDEAHFSNTMLMSYSTKFSSNFYGPFREAAESTPQQGDRKAYQIDYRNKSDAIACSIRDLEQGADMIMVKPAMAYLDIIRDLKTDPRTSLAPLAAYHVSGEYQSLHVMAKEKLLDFSGAYYESLIAIRRAGADMIITYGANDFTTLYPR